MRPAIASDIQFTIQLQRLVGCGPNDWDHAQRAVKLWLLVGALGRRANRAAGSVWPLDVWVPQDAKTLKMTLKTLGLRNWSVALIGEGKGKSVDILRKTASDTIAGKPHRQVFGGINDRKPSPTKFKVAMLEAQAHQPAEPCLLAVAPLEWVSGCGGVRRTILQQAEHLLFAKPDPTRWNALTAWNHLLP